MNFEDVIRNLANQTAVDRSANIGADFRGKAKREDLLSQKKLFLNEKKIYERFSTHEEYFDIKRFLVSMILSKGDYSISDDLKSIEKEIITFRKYLIDNESFIHWDKNKREIYETVLETVLEDKKVSQDEWKVLKKLQKKLDINLHNHWILRIKKDLFDEVNKTSTALTDDKLKGYLRDLQKQGLIFHVDKEGRRYIIPEEIAENLKGIIGVELQDYKYKELLNNPIITIKDKVNFLKRKGIDAKGSSDKLNKIIIANRLRPSDFLNSLSSKTLHRMTTKLAIKKSGSKDQKIKRIVQHYDERYIPSEKPEDSREIYYKFYEDLANRNQSILIKKGIISKGEQIGNRFEEATRYLFGNVLGFNLKSPVIKSRRAGVKADGKAVKGNDFIIWDCKTKDKYFTMSTAERRQFVDYINEYKKADSNNFISFLIVTPELKSPDILRKQLTDIKGETGVDISIVKAIDLKEFADKIKKSGSGAKIRIFYNTRILDRGYLESISTIH